ncbi:hypothetical protein GCM10027168_18800 [Streptomyces capparidis]
MLGNLPAEMDGFVGRQRELAEVGRLLERARTVTVTGPGGVGKSRLALRAAAAARHRFPGGAWLVELSALGGPEQVGPAVAAALGLAPGSGRPREALGEHLAGRELLLVLDACEHLVQECADLVGELLRRAPGLRVLATSRQPLGVCGEHGLPLAPLGDDAVALFEERAGAVVPGFRVHDGNRAAVVELCRRLDGIPLAVELAAGRLRALSLEQLLARLHDRFGLLTDGSRTAPPRHRALRTAIGWSHELCTPQERLLWSRLSVFAGDFDLEAAEYVCADRQLPGQEVLGLLADLVAKSVAAREDGPAGVRYRLLETVREYGAGWLARLGEGERLRRRHRDWYLGLVTWGEADWFSRRQGEVAARVERESANIRLALEFSLATPGEARFGQYMAGALWFHWAGCGRLTEGRQWLDRALELPASSGEAHAKALLAAGHLALLQGSTRRARRLLRECEERALARRDPAAAAGARHRLGSLALATDDLPRAEELLREALRAYHELGEPVGAQVMAQNELALAVGFQGRLDEAVALGDEVREVCRDHGERWARAHALYGLGRAAWLRGAPERARVLLEEALAVHHAFRDLVGVALTVELLALLTLFEGRPAEAALLLGAAGRVRAAAGLPACGSRYFDAPRARCERRARQRLGDARFEEAFRLGGRLGLDELAARAPRAPRPVAELPAGGRDAQRPAVTPPTGAVD